MNSCRVSALSNDKIIHCQCAGWYIWSDSWVGSDVPLSCPAAQPVLPNSHHSKQNRAEGGTAIIRVNPIQPDGPPCNSLDSGSCGSIQTYSSVRLQAIFLPPKIVKLSKIAPNCALSLVEFIHL